MLPQSLVHILQSHVAESVAILAVTVLVLLITLAWAMSRLAKLTRMYARLTRGVSGGNLEEVLGNHLDTVTGMSGRVSHLEELTSRLSAVQSTCYQRAGLVRFDAFEDVGGCQSFSLALLDSVGDGVVISGIYSRTDVRVYTKQIISGKATQKLSDDEVKAVAKAQEPRP